MRGVRGAVRGLPACWLVLLAVLSAGILAAPPRVVMAQAGTDYQVTCRIEPAVLVRNQPARLRVQIENVPVYSAINVFDVKMLSSSNKSTHFTAKQADIGNFLSPDMVMANILGPHDGEDPEEDLPAGGLRVAVVENGIGEVGSGELFSAPFYVSVDGETTFKFVSVALYSAGDEIGAVTVDCTADVYKTYYLPMVNPSQGDGEAGE